jgi:hypothetical protein
MLWGEVISGFSVGEFFQKSISIFSVSSSCIAPFHRFVERDGKNFSTASVFSHNAVEI